MPADYVNKLARMFQDIKVSEDLNQSFKEMHKHNKLALPGKRKYLMTITLQLSNWFKIKFVLHWTQVFLCVSLQPTPST